MFKASTTAAIAVTAVITATAFTFATAPASQVTPERVIEAPETETAWRDLNAPAACDGEVWPYQSAHCVAAIMAENGKADRRVRVLTIYEPAKSLKLQAIAKLEMELRPTR